MYQHTHSLYITGTKAYYTSRRLLSTVRVTLASLLATVVVLLATISSAHAAPTVVWSDNFTATNLDTSKWTAVNEPSWNRYERESYSYNNTYIWGGDLVLKSSMLPGNVYTSGEVTTAHTFSFTYGTIDIRARLPHGQGIWPAFWLLSANCQMYPSTTSGCAVTPTTGYGEIDIMEMLGQNPNYMYMTNHFGSLPGQNLSHQCTYTGPNYSADYHIFSVNWQPNSITWLIDGIPHCQQTDGVPNGPMFLVLNTAIGGMFPGNPNITTPFPQYTEINYVHISQ